MKTVLVTGATRGIGLEMAKQLAKKGHFVYLGSRNTEKGDEVVKGLKAEGFTNIEALTLDVTNAETIAKAKAKVEQEKGKLDILINNAGILGGMEQDAQNTSLSIIKEVFETNLFGVISVTQAFLPLLKKSESPRITNVTSGLASLTLHSDPNWKYYQVKGAAYGPSKSALNAYTIVLAYELKDTPFKVNAIDPGYTSTEFNHHNGPLSPEASAAFVIKHTDSGADAPTGHYFSHDITDGTEISPW
ncbi:SDR family oxidoreductase [Flavobacterium alkalisoli]|uniref:SDR family oxidoreductase n=1 Tax=Flavobacterium alkalisoli TaxID=2602769 RepID=UPI003A94B718